MTGVWSRVCLSGAAVVLASACHPPHDCKKHLCLTVWRMHAGALIDVFSKMVPLSNAWWCAQIASTACLQVQHS